MLVFIAVLSLPSIAAGSGMTESLADLVNGSHPVLLVKCKAAVGIQTSWRAQCTRLNENATIPPSFTLDHAGPARPSPAQHEVSVISVVKVGERIHLRPRAPTGVTVPAPDVPAVRLLLAGWTPPGNPLTVIDLDQYLGLLRHSSAFGRQLGFELLRASEHGLKPLMNRQRVDAIGQLLLEPGWPQVHQRTVIECMMRLGGSFASEWFNQHFFTDLPRHLITPAIIALGRQDDAVAQRVIRRCSKALRGLSQRLCQHRVRGQVPSPPGHFIPTGQ
ncbi:MAG: hypothetical protein VX589_10955 [Myxococcota bacterium]|nr:hypothetical protein [Myxococcota bacterium]